METSINVKDFISFTSYSLVIDGNETNQWSQSRPTIESYKNAIDSNIELQKIILDSFAKFNHFDNCTFIDIKLLKNLPVKVFQFYDLPSYYKFKVDNYGDWPNNRDVEIVSISGSTTNRELFTEKYAKTLLFCNNRSTQLDRLYNNLGQRAKEIHCCVFNYGYHYSSIF